MTHAIQDFRPPGAKKPQVWLVDLVDELDPLLDELYVSGKGSNIFYSVAAVKNTKKPPRESWKILRQNFESLGHLAFDLDKVDFDRTPSYDVVILLEEFFEETGKRWYVHSGNGIHVILKIRKQNDVKLFQKLKKRYRAFCEQIHVFLELKGVRLKEVDPRIFEPARILRLPGTLNVRPGRPTTECFTIAVEGKGLCSKTWARLKEVKVVEAVTEDGSDFDAETFLMKASNVQDRGDYVLFSCPFHPPDESPSMWLYKHRNGYAFDGHLSAGDEGYVVSPYRLWLKLTYGDTEDSRERADKFQAETGVIPQDVLRPVSDMIRSWADDHWQFTHGNSNGHLYSPVFKKFVGKTEFKDKFDPALLRLIYLQGEGLDSTREKGDETVMPRIWRDQAGSVFAHFIGELPKEHDLQEVDSGSRQKVIHRIQQVLNRAVPFWNESSSRGYHGTLLSRARALPPNFGKGWTQFDSFEAYFRKDMGKLGVALRFALVRRLDTAWAGQLETATAFGRLLSAMKLGESKVISVDSAKLRAWVLTDEVIQEELEGIEIPDSLPKEIS